MTVWCSANQEVRPAEVHAGGRRAAVERPHVAAAERQFIPPMVGQTDA